MFSILGFYKFTQLKNLKNNKYLLQTSMIKNHVRGNIILANEGINGTIAGKKINLNKIQKKIFTILKIKNFDNKNNSLSRFQPFHRAQVKIKKEVVPIGLQLDKKTKQKNQYIEPDKWNDIIKNKKTFLIDARKSFEYKVGTFQGAVNPNVNHFKDFPKFLKKIKKTQPVAMFCTGGIRCEKASAYLLNKGFKNVYQLKGGILNYLDKVKKEKSLWKGECYVFDNRVSVKHKLEQGTYSICGGCRTPISLLEKKSKKYEEGVSCPNCHDKLTPNQMERFRMRQKQISLAKHFGTKHIFQKEFK